MVGPVRVDGLFSGLDVSGIINNLLAVQRQPISRFEGKIAIAAEKKASFLQVNANILAFKGIADTLSRPSFFQRTNVSSTNENVISASGDQVGATGAFTFSVRRLAVAHQVVSSGFADKDTTAVTTSAATVTMEMGGGFLERGTRLETLNGGIGVDRGLIQITDSTAANGTAVIDLEGAVTVGDVLDAINNNTQVNVMASIGADRIVLSNPDGGSTFTVANYGSDTTASDLGIVGTGAAGPSSKLYVYGANVNYALGTTTNTSLNDGLGIRRNSDGVTDFTITGPNGTPVAVDIQSTDTTLQSIIDRINTAAGANFTASLTSDGSAIQLVGASDGSFSVAVGAGSLAAQDLGFVVYDGGTYTTAPTENATDGTPGAGGDVSQRMVGHRLIGTMNSTLRNLLNGGQTHTNAVSNVTGAAGLGATSITVDNVDNLVEGDRIRIVEGAVTQVRRIKSISSTTITLDTALTSAITAAADVWDLQRVGDGSITVTDRQGDSHTVDLSARISTTLSAASGIGATTLNLASVDGFSVGNKFRVVGGGTVQIRTITDINTATNVITFDQALTSAVSLGDGIHTDHSTLGQMLNTLNDRMAANNVNVQFEFDAEQNGIRAVDFSGGTGSLTIADATGTVAQDLGIAGTATSNVIDGTDLDVQYISTYTRLTTLNGGGGVQAGSIRITDTTAKQFTVDLSQSNDTTIQSVITDINGAASAAGSSVTARINNTGDGILLVDTAGGTGTLRVDESGGTRTARDLNLLGTAPSGQSHVINGSFERRITIDAGSTLEEVRNAINGGDLPVTASIVNDGSPTNPYRLSVISQKSGTAGRIVLDSEISGLSFETTSVAKDSILLFGNPGSDPLLLSGSSNQYTEVVPGLTLNLKGQSNSAVTISVSRDLPGVVDQMDQFVEKYNSAIQLIRELTFFDESTFQKGALFADPTIRRILQDLSTSVTRPVGEIPSGNLRTMQSVGLNVTDLGGLTLDKSKFETSLNDKFSEVVDLFTRQRRLELGTLTKDINNGLGLSTTSNGVDMKIFARDAITQFTVDLTGVTTVGGITSAINNAVGNGGAITAAIAADGFSITLTDSSSVPNRDIDTVVSLKAFQETAFVGKADDLLNGATVTFLDGANAGQVRTVTDFVGATGEMTLDSDLPNAMTAGDSYRIERKIEVQTQNSSKAANELKLVGSAKLGQTTYDGGLINLKNDPGVGFRVSESMDGITRSDSGIISTRTDSLDDRIDRLTDDIERAEERISNMEVRLVREFSRLESIIAQSQGTMSRLQSTLGAFTSMLASSGGRLV